VKDLRLPFAPPSNQILTTAVLRPHRPGEKSGICTAMFRTTNYHCRMGWNQEQLLGFALTDWLLTSGESVERKIHTLRSLDGLSHAERLLWEFWIFDMEQQNGGVGQYFLNRPVLHWNSLFALSRSALPSFSAFSEKIESNVSGAPDPHAAFHQIEVDVDGLYSEIRVPVLRELQTFIQNHLANAAKVEPGGREEV